MKNVLSIILVGAVSVLSLVGCGGSDGGDPAPAPAAGSSTGGSGTGSGGGSSVTKGEGGGARVRFILATPELKIGEGFDICYLPGATSGDFKGPLAKGYDASLTAPEITRYFPLDVSNQYISTRIVKAGGGCAESDRLPSPPSLKGFVDEIRVNDDKTPLEEGGDYAMFVYGTVDPSVNSSKSLTARLRKDPSGATELNNPKLSFFNAIVNTDLEITTVYAIGGVEYSFELPSVLSYGADQVVDAFQGDEKEGEASVRRIKAKAGDKTFEFELNDQTAIKRDDKSYYWVVAYGNNADDMQMWVARDVFSNAESGNVVMPISIVGASSN